jgi:excisionase family DNA binding protein
MKETAMTTIQTNQSDHPLLTVTDVAEALGVGERFVRRLTAERRMPFFKIGAKVRFAREDLEAFMASSRQPVGHLLDPSELAELWELHEAAQIAGR